MNTPEKAWHIVSPLYDWTFFLLPPLFALILGVAISGSAAGHAPFELFGSEQTWIAIFIGALIHAHLVAVVFRSHANPGIFRLYRARFVIVPVALWALLVASEWLAVAATVVATFWDVWHSGAQTFGFARIYERNHGTPPHVARSLDFWVNQLLYAGPILAGATLMDHVESFENFEGLDDAGALFFTHVPAYVEGRQQVLTWIVVIGGTAFLAYYVYRHIVLSRQGYAPSVVKVYLVASTGLCSIYTWGFNTWGEAFFIMNFFHAVQYLALVWAMEHRRIGKRLRLQGRPRGRLLTAGLFFGSVGAYGCAAQLADPAIETFWALTIVVSLMHFWYDAFIWSVKKKQI